MLAIRHYPYLVTDDLQGRLFRRARYDANGRASAWLYTGMGLLDPELANIARIVCPEVPVSQWCGVLVQHYRDGRATTPCHSDYGSTGFGFLVSLGATRTFRTHRVPEGAKGCGDYDLDSVSIECVSGTAIVMEEKFHQHHDHQVIADPGAGERLSLVFRTKPSARG